MDPQQQYQQHQHHQKQMNIKETTKGQYIEMDFDPQKILETVLFPMDHFLNFISKSRKARISAVYYKPVHEYAGDLIANLVNEGYYNLINLSHMEDRLNKAAAVVLIQSVWRGYLTRKLFFELKYPDFSVDSIADSESVDAFARSFTSLPSVSDLTVQESLIEKFTKYRYFIEKHGRHFNFSFPEFCAIKIQTQFRMKLAWKFVSKKRKEKMRKDKIFKTLKSQRERDLYINLCAARIQRRWRKYKMSEAFRYIRSLLLAHEQYDPKQLLRVLSPVDCQFLDPTSKVHLRFRLGGTTYPPNIYYKVFLNQGPVDLNSFAPRNYKLTQIQMSLGFPKSPHDGWYERIDNNHWRIIDKKKLKESLDQIENKRPSVPYHHLKTVRIQDATRRKKQRKIEWLQKLYIQAHSNHQEDNDNLFDEDENLIAWTKGLDFEKYSEEWLRLGLVIEHSNGHYLTHFNQVTTNQTSSFISSTPKMKFDKPSTARSYASSQLETISAFSERSWAIASETSTTTSFIPT